MPSSRKVPAIAKSVTRKKALTTLIPILLAALENDEVRARLKQTTARIQDSVRNRRTIERVPSLRSLKRRLAALNKTMDELEGALAHQQVPADSLADLRHRLDEAKSQLMIAKRLPPEGSVKARLSLDTSLLEIEESVLYAAGLGSGLS